MGGLRLKRIKAAIYSVQRSNLGASINPVEADEGAGSLIVTALSEERTGLMVHP